MAAAQKPRSVELEPAERLRVECKVSERRWWRLKAAGLKEACNWSALSEMGTARRAPTGFKKVLAAALRDAPPEWRIADK